MSSMLRGDVHLFVNAEDQGRANGYTAQSMIHDYVESEGIDVNDVGFVTEHEDVAEILRYELQICADCFQGQNYEYSIVFNKDTLLFSAGRIDPDWCMSEALPFLED